MASKRNISLCHPYHVYDSYSPYCLADAAPYSFCGNRRTSPNTTNIFPVADCQLALLLMSLWLYRPTTDPHSLRVVQFSLHFSAFLLRHYVYTNSNVSNMKYSSLRPRSEYLQQSHHVHRLIFVCYVYNTINSSDGDMVNTKQTHSMAYSICTIGSMLLARATHLRPFLTCILPPLSAKGRQRRERETRENAKE